MKEIYKKQLLGIIQEHAPKRTNVYLFGSRARGTDTFGSDIDIALDAGNPLALSALGSIKEAIENSNIPFFVDVVDLQTIASDFKKTIEGEGILWKKYC